MSLSSFIRWLALPAMVATFQPQGMAQYGFESIAPYFGVYFGTFENGQGRWGMLVSWQGEGHFDFIGRLPGSGTVIRSYPYAAEVYIGGGFEGVTPFVSGQIKDDGKVIGAARDDVPPNVFGPVHSLQGQLDGAPGPGSAYSGFWRWSDGRPDYVDTTVTAVVGASGTTFVVLKTPYVGDEDGMTTIDAEGRFSLMLSGGTRVAGRVDRATAKLEATVTREGGFAAGPGRAVNFSTLGSVGSGGAFVHGFTIAGGTGKRLLFRAVGSPLATLLGAGSYLINPKVEIWRGAELVARDDDWNSSDPALRAAIAQTGALPLSPGSKDAAFTATLPPGSYTMAAFSAESGGTGTVLSEIFDLEPDNGSLLNLSTQAAIGRGSAGLVSGFVIAGDRPRSVLIRAVGPGLGSVIPGRTANLPDPWLEVKTSSGVTVAANDNWPSYDPHVAAAARAAGTFPLPSVSKDAALLVTLAPGAYTATVRSGDTAGGTVLLEVYDSEDLPSLTKARLAVDAISVTKFYDGYYFFYQPRLHLVETGGLSAATIVRVRLFLDDGASAVPIWEPRNRTVPAGGNRELIEKNLDPEFGVEDTFSAEFVSLLITYRDDSGNEDSVWAGARVTPSF